jgi:hypothetical protein
VILNACSRINKPLSGGLPHSEIPGSKGALASPGLIAECHVLHRLLLPRHPPNALLALDPIQKTTGPFVCGGSSATRRQRSGRKSLTRTHPLGRRRAGCDPRNDHRGQSEAHGQCLRLGKTVFGVRPPPAARGRIPTTTGRFGPGVPPLGNTPKTSRVLLSSRCQIEDCLVLRSDRKAHRR